MKSERRHELEKNTLADWLGNAIEQIKPYASTILLGILGIVVVWFAANWWMEHNSAAQANAWDAYYTAFEDPNPSEGFGKVAELYPRSDVALWATVSEADFRLNYGSNQLFSANRVMAKQELKKAIDGYLTVLTQATLPPLRERATFGLARAKEAMGDLDEAIKSYEEVVKQWPDGAYHADAQHRIDALNRQSTRQFYDAFAKAEPQPVPADVGTGPEFNDKTLPEGPSTPAADATKPVADAKSATDTKPVEKTTPAEAKK